MSTRSIFTFSIIIGLLLAGAAPALASGPWLAGEGVPEPNTKYDTSDLMQPIANDANHPGGIAERVYFNGFLITSDGYSANPAEGSPYPSRVRHAAFLGFWRDCNGDGYVGAKTVPDAPAGQYGHFSNGAYPATGATVDTTLCPPQTAYNHDGFIDEFRWIGPNATPTAEEDVRGAKYECDPLNWVTIIEDCTKLWNDRYDVTDRDARVWADWRRPDEPAAATRPLLAEDMVRHSDGTLEFLNFALHFDTLLETERTLAVPLVGPLTIQPAEEGTWENKPNFGACGDEREFGGGPEFAGTGQGTCGMYPLWQANRLVTDEGEDRNATPLVGVWDMEHNDRRGESPCDDTELPGGFLVADPEPRVTDDPLMDGSVVGTVLVNWLGGVGGAGLGFGQGECDPYSPGVFSEPPVVEGKTSADSPLSFNGDERFRALRTYGVDEVPVNVPGVAYGARWTGTTGYVVLSRTPAATSEEFATFYADVSPDAFRNAGFSASATQGLPAKAQDAHKYGDVQCASFDDTPENRRPNTFGWVCSRDAWDSENYYPGRAYDMRDVDCYDQSPSHAHPATESPEIVIDTGGGPGTEIVVRTTCASWHT